MFFCEGERWELREGDEVLGEYLWQHLRYSISWKAYCFKTEQEQLAWSEGSDDLSLDKILAILEAELRDQNVLKGPRPEPTDFAVMMVEHFIQFPSAPLG
ncbi:MAG: hypothetical protein AB8B81_16055 [Halioglobus sp.]